MSRDLCPAGCGPRRASGADAARVHGSENQESRRRKCPSKESPCCSPSLRQEKAAVPAHSPLEGSLLCNLFALVRPSTDWVRPTCPGAGSLLYSACGFRC